ncbi:MAG TPA: ABC transporter permease [Longimicrobiales bacterium]
MSRLILWIRANLFRGRYEREMRDEMAAHLDRATQQLVARGMRPPDARVQAERDFGNVEFLKTEGRDARGTLWLDAILADTRFAFRQYGRRRGTVFMMFCVLVFGMSLSTLLFTGLFAYTKQAPPGVEVNDLVRIRGIQDAREYGRSGRRFSETEYRAYTQLPQFQDVVGHIDNPVSFTPVVDAENGARQGTVTFVSANYFRVLNVRPVIGGGLGASPDRATIAVLTDVAWKKYFGQRSDVIGSTVSINGVDVTIVGVAPPAFNGVSGRSDMDKWEPIAWMPLAAKLVIAPGIEPRYIVVARLADGVSREAATAAVNAVAANSMTAEERSTNTRAGAEVVPMLSLNLSPDFDESVRFIWVFMGAIAGLVLLLTCANVSALLTGLAASRRHEIAVRLSLGASRGRVIRQLLTESATLAVIAGCAALAVVAGTVRLAMSLVPYLSVPLEITWPATTYTFAVALAVGGLFGLSPALHATRIALSNVLRDSGTGVASSSSKLQRGLVAAQLAFTQPTIVVLTALIIAIVAHMQTQRSDIADRIVMVSVRTPGYTENGASPELMTQQRERLHAVAENVGGMPGVQHVALDAAPPFWNDFDVADRAAPTRPIKLRPWGASPEYFDVMGLPIIAGRTFHPSEATDSSSRATQVPVIIAADLAAKLWGGSDALGRRIEPLDTALARRELVVVGVIDDPLVAANRKPNEPYRIYFTPDTTWAQDMVYVRTATSATPLLPKIRSTALEATRGGVIGLRTIAQDDAESERTTRAMAAGAMGAGAIAVLLSALGLYAVISFAVGQRTQEIAVRMSLGARSGQIANVFLGEGLRLGGVGMLIGLPFALFALITLRVQLNLENMPIAPVTLLATFAVLLVAALSAWMPARRAAAVNPAESLRQG